MPSLRDTPIVSAACAQHCQVCGLDLEKTLIFNGPAGIGKSELLKALGAQRNHNTTSLVAFFCFARSSPSRSNCEWQDRTAFGYGAIDSFGAVTKVGEFVSRVCLFRMVCLCALFPVAEAGQMEECAAFCFDDFSLKTRGGTHQLDIEEVTTAFVFARFAPWHSFRTWTTDQAVSVRQAASKHRRVLFAGDLPRPSPTLLVRPPRHTQHIRCSFIVHSCIFF